MVKTRKNVWTEIPMQKIFLRLLEHGGTETARKLGRNLFG